MCGLVMMTSFSWFPVLILYLSAYWAEKLSPKSVISITICTPQSPKRDVDHDMHASVPDKVSYPPLSFSNFRCYSAFCSRHNYVIFFFHICQDTREFLPLSSFFFQDTLGMSHSLYENSTFSDIYAVTYFRPLFISLLVSKPSYLMLERHIVKSTLCDGHWPLFASTFVIIIYIVTSHIV